MVDNTATHPQLRTVLKQALKDKREQEKSPGATEKGSKPPAKLKKDKKEKKVKSKKDKK